MGRHRRSRGLFELPAIAERVAGWLGESDHREVTLSAACLHHASQSSRSAGGAASFNVGFAVRYADNGDVEYLHPGAGADNGDVEYLHPGAGGEWELTGTM